jgi:peptide/nickel transport system substrate-binding protein
MDSKGENYWERLAWRRINRRQVFAGGTAGLALIAAGCSSSNNKGGNRAAAGSAQPSAAGSQAAASRAAGTAAAPAGAAATSAQAVPKTGGTLRTYQVGDPESFDNYINYSDRSSYHDAFVYSKLAKYRSGADIKPNEFSAELDLASALEQPDNLTHIFKLDDKAVWQDKSPVNGRPLTAADVVYNLDLYRNKHTNRILLAPYIDTVEAIDTKTVRFRMKSPVASFLLYIGHHGGPYMYPPELKKDDGTRGTMIGSGPWILGSYDVGKKISYVRNPKFYKAPLPYLDSIEVSFIADPSTQAANLRTGAIDVTAYALVPADEVANLKKTIPKARFSEPPTNTINAVTVDIGDDRFKDARVRQAISVSLDRDAILAVGSGGDTWPTALPPLLPWWLDPKKDDKLLPFFKRDLKRAKQLLSAAGFGNGIPNVIMNANAGYGPKRIETAQLIAANLREAGIDVKLNVQEQAEFYATTFVGKHVGQMGENGVIKGTEPDEVLTLLYSPDSARSPIPNKTLLAQDTRLAELLTKQRSELDKDKRKAVLFDLQRYLAEQMYMVPQVSDLEINMSQPKVRDMNWLLTFAPARLFDAVWLEQ